VLQAQGKLAEAQAAFGEDLRISRKLADQDPTNAGWQQELAVACVMAARAATRQGQRSQALPLFEEASRILARLALTAPDFAQWAQDRAVVEMELASCRSRAGEPES
jgi:tetratricopeptide (TPR) repeat protein